MIKSTAFPPVSPKPYPPAAPPSMPQTKAPTPPVATPSATHAPVASEADKAPP